METLNKANFPVQKEYVEQYKQGLCTVTELCINLLETGFHVQRIGDSIVLIRDNPDGSIGEMGFPNTQELVF